MRIPTHIRQSRHGIFFFRIVVPKALRPIFDGRSEIKRSLHTRNIRVALVQARQMSLAAYQLFDLVKSSMTRKIDINDPSTLTSENVVGRFEYTVEEDLNTGKRVTRIRTDPSSPDSIAAGRAVAMAIETKKQLLMGKVETDNPEALAADDQLRRELAEILGAGQANTAVVAATLPVSSSGSDEHIPAVPRKTVLDTTRLTPKDRQRMLSVLWAAYAKQETKSNWTKGRTPQEYAQKFGIFLDWIGDRPIHWVTKQDYSAFKNWMLSDYRTAAWKPGQPTGIAARSLDKYTSAINGLFKWAQTSGYFPEKEPLPTALQTIMSKTAIKKLAKKRIANRNFRDTELAIAFKAKEYIFENQVVHHFWGPLIALFTGARRAEVSQLLIRDIRQTQDGLWIIDINDDDVSKNIKNQSARRTVPIHPTLIEIGFLDYLAEVKAAGLGEQLFPDVGVNKFNEKGNSVGNAWRRFLIKRGLRTAIQKEDDPDTLTFHSLRHTSINLLREAGVPYDLRCQMVGHDSEGQHAEYGGAAAAAKLAEIVLPLFKYPDLDFSELRYKVGSLAIKKKQGYPRKSRGSEDETKETSAAD